MEDGNKISGCQGLGVGEGMNRWNTEDFQRRENSLYVNITMDKCHHTFVQTHRTYNTKNLKVSYKLGVNVGSSTGTNETLWWDVDNGGGHACVEAGYAWENLCTFCLILM